MITELPKNRRLDFFLERDKQKLEAIKAKEDEAKKIAELKAELSIQIRAELQEKIRLELEYELRAKIKSEVEAEIKAKEEANKPNYVTKINDKPLLASGLLTLKDDRYQLCFDKNGSWSGYTQSDVELVFKFEYEDGNIEYVKVPV